MSFTKWKLKVIVLIYIHVSQSLNADGMTATFQSSAKVDILPLVKVDTQAAVFEPRARGPRRARRGEIREHIEVRHLSPSVRTSV